jgi:hypothetical protein
LRHRERRWPLVKKKQQRLEFRHGVDPIRYEPQNVICWLFHFRVFRQAEAKTRRLPAQVSMQRTVSASDNATSSSAS